ncbi:MAG: NAD(P)-dependent oxidoreductase, partial [Chloroflexi bacterium]|nr:NAD(P)-dependent oxidoreductase [Chloroflexota bacterium]
MTRVGFIGLGNMGAPIARRLVQAGLDPIVFDQSEAALQKLAEAGARTAASCAGVAAEADMIGVCVRDDADVEAAVLGVDGVLGSAKEGSLVALHSTILPTTV